MNYHVFRYLKILHPYNLRGEIMWDFFCDGHLISHSGNEFILADCDVVWYDCCDRREMYLRGLDLGFAVQSLPQFYHFYLRW